MADLGLLIPDYLEMIGARVIYQLFLNGSEQLAKAEVKKAKLLLS